MKNKKKKYSPSIPHLLQAQQVLVLLYAKVTMKSVDNVLLLLVFNEINFLFSGIIISFVHSNSFILPFCYFIIIIFLQSAQP